MIGNAFLENQKCKIDYIISTFFINSTPISLYCNTCKNLQSNLILKPKTETVIPIKIYNPNNLHKSTIPSQFLNNSSTEHYCWNLNVSIDVKHVPSPELNVDLLPIDPQIFQFNCAEKVPSDNRLEILEENLRLNYLNSKEQ